MEAPYSYLLAVGLSGLSCILRRQCWFELFGAGRTYPTLSVILIGPTGIGKDTTINLGRKYILDEFMTDHEVGGITSEGIASGLLAVQEKLQEETTTGFICANEMKRLFGSKDYQEGMVAFLTDIMSEGIKAYHHGTKHKPFTVVNPTLVLQAGSTEEWFHQLPKDALAGGFIPRCLVVVERAARAMIALPGDYMDFQDRQYQNEAIKKVYEGIEWIEDNYVSKPPRELIMEADAKPIYENWYHNRYKLIGPLAQGYAHRARGHVAKMAMISAVCRRKMIMDTEDIVFAINVMNELISVMEKVILPPTEEGRCVAAIREFLPATSADLVVMLRPKFPERVVTNTIRIMLSTKEIKQNGGFLVDNLTGNVV